MMQYNYPTSAFLYSTPCNYTLPYYNYQPWAVQTNQNYGSGIQVSNDMGLFNIPMQQYGGNFYHQYSDIMSSPWNRPLNWFENQQSYFPSDQWKSSFPFNWMNLNSNYDRAAQYWSWPTYNYFSSPQYPIYSWPKISYWKTENTYSPETLQPHGNTMEESYKMSMHPEHKLSSRKNNLPVEVTKRTMSEVKRIMETSITIKKPIEVLDQSLKTEETVIPYVVNISDTSIQQITSSRSFLGSSIVTKSRSEI